MANEKDIKIGLQTVGADAAAAKIAEVGREVKKLPDSGGGVDDLGGKFTELDERVKKLRESTGELEETQAKNASTMRVGGAATLGLGVGLGLVKNAFADLNQEIKKLDLVELKKIDPEAEKAVKSLISMTEWVVKPFAALERFFNGSVATEQIQKLTQKMLEATTARQDLITAILSQGEEDAGRVENIVGRLNAARNLAAAKGAADVAERNRINAGRGPDTSADAKEGRDALGREASAIAEDVLRNADAMIAGLKPLRERLESASKALDASRENLKAVEQLPNATPEEKAQANDDFREKSDKVIGLSQDLRDASNLLAENLRAAKEGGLAQIEAMARDAGEAVTDAAQAAIEEIRSNAKSQGREVNPLEQEGIDRANKLLNDTTPDAQQAGQIAGILQSVANNLTANNAGLITGLDRIITMLGTQKTQQDNLSKKIDGLEQRINQIK